MLRALFPLHPVLEIRPVSGSCLPDVPFVQCLLVSAGIGLMLCERMRKIVCAGEILLCAHIQVIVMRIVQHAFDGMDRCYADWSGRKPLYFIGIVRAVRFQMLVQDASQPEVLQSELYGRGIPMRSRFR